MLVNLALGLLLISATVMIHMAGLIVLTRAMTALVQSWHLDRDVVGKSAAMVLIVLGLFAIHTVEVWAWALTYFFVEAVPRFQDSLYFSTVTFSTLGYGDIILTPDWRLFGSLEGVNGFLLIGWSTAFLVSASTRYGPFRSGEHF